MIRWAARLKHTGEFLGVPPTGREVHLTGISIGRVVDGKLAEAWSNSDVLGVLQQLGVVPAPEQAKVAS